MNEKEENSVNKIRESYAPKTVTVTKYEEIIALDKRVKRPAKIFSYIFGTAGALILGTGMCLAMGVIGASLSFAFPLGIGIGCAGIIICSINYPIYKGMVKAGKKKYGEKILKLSDEFLNE